MKKTMDQRSAMEAAVTEILGQFAMMIGEVVSKGDPDCVRQGCLKAEMTIKGSETIDACMLAPYTLARQIASNVLGTDLENVTSESSADALKEFLNIVAGKFAALLYGEQAVVDLTPPVVTVLHVNPRATRTGGAALWFDVEGQPLLAEFRVRGGRKKGK